MSGYSTEYSPKDAAYEIAIGCLYKACKQCRDMSVYAGKSQNKKRREIKKWLVHLHNKLVEESGMEGMILKGGD